MASKEGPGKLEELPLALTVAQAADLLQVSPSTIYEHPPSSGHRRSRLPARRLGRCLRVPRVVIFGMLGLEPGGAGPGGDRGAA